MQDTDPRPSSSPAAVAENVPEPSAVKAPESSANNKKKQWVRLSDERSFGSITGSEFRVWGE